LDVSSLVNAISGWSHRTITFGSHWHCRTSKQNIGKVSDITPFLVSQITPDVNALLCQDLWDMEAAVTWVKDMLKTFDLQGARI
jgi:hypothetical protein